jgi:glycine cleavage system H protein
MHTPTELLYTTEHEWVRVEGDFAFIGITDFAQSELGDIVFVELPEVDTEIKQGEVFGTVESVKTVSELYAPLTGKVVAVNNELEDAPEYVNTSAYEDGWMIKVEIANTAELDKLLSASQYQDQWDN